MGRSRVVDKSRHVTFRTSEERCQQLQEVGAALGIGVSAVINQVLAQGLPDLVEKAAALRRRQAPIGLPPA